MSNIKLPRKLKKWLKEGVMRPSYKYQNGLKSKHVRITGAEYRYWMPANYGRRRARGWFVQCSLFAGKR
jgi:hypothetical protein